MARNGGGQAADTSDARTLPLLHDNLQLLPYLPLRSCGSAATPLPGCAETACRSVSCTPADMPHVGIAHAPLYPPRHVSAAAAICIEVEDAGQTQLCEFLRYDADIQRQESHFNAFFGNASCVLPGCDGPIIAVGQGPRLDSVVLLKNGAGARLDPIGSSCALPAGRRVFQLAASPDPSQGQHRLLLARGLHWLHFLQFEPMRTDGPVLRGAASVTLGRRPLHACPNPHLASEVACLLEDGQLCVLNPDLASSKASKLTVPFCGTDTNWSGRHPRARGALRAEIPTAATFQARCAADTPATLPVSHVSMGYIPLSPTSDPEGALPPRAVPWGAAEYTAHPRVLYVASCAGTYRRDLREPPASSLPLLFEPAISPCLGGAIAVPLLTAPISAPLFALASTEQLLLFDARSPHAPVQQWRLPLPTGAVAAAGSQSCVSAQPSPPRFFCQFDDAGHAIHLMDRWTGHHLAYPCLPPSLGSHRERPSYVQPYPPPGTLGAVSVESVYSQRRRLGDLEGAGPGCIFPLAASIMLSGQSGVCVRPHQEWSGVPASLMPPPVLVLTASGAVSTLRCGIAADAVPGTHAATVPISSRSRSPKLRCAADCKYSDWYHVRDGMRSLRPSDDRLLRIANTVGLDNGEGDNTHGRASVRASNTPRSSGISVSWTQASGADTGQHCRPLHDPSLLPMVGRAPVEVEEQGSEDLPGGAGSGWALVDSLSSLLTQWVSWDDTQSSEMCPATRYVQNPESSCIVSVVEDPVRGLHERRAPVQAPHIPRPGPHAAVPTVKRRKTAASCVI